MCGIDNDGARRFGAVVVDDLPLQPGSDLCVVKIFDRAGACSTACRVISATAPTRAANVNDLDMTSSSLLPLLAGTITEKVQWFLKPTR